ncbi:MAG: hypothetical protein ACQGQP_05640 [Desulfovibrio sp.]|jgi:hypothetical protein|nr:hypothetical protein [Mailhella sp.]
MEHIALVLENGARLSFEGRLFAEAVWEDEESGVLTHHKLYMTGTNSQVYALFKERAGRRIVRAYRVTVKDGLCTIFDGKETLRMPVEGLLDAVQALCGSDPALLGQVEEALLSASC